MNTQNAVRSALATLAALAISVQLAAQEQPAGHRHHHYKLIDVGTFGGPNALLSYPLPGEVQINQRGLVVGAADTSEADPYSPNCLLDCFLNHAFAWQNGVLTNLGALPGTNNSYAFSSNNRGQVVGVSENGDFDPLTGYPELHGVLWSDGELIDLGTLGGSVSFAGTINNRGQVVGAAFNNIPDSFGGSLAIPPLFPVATQSRAFLWERGVMQDLGTLGGPDSQAQYINDYGEVAGQSFTDSTLNPPSTAPACPTPGIPTQHPFLWQRGRLIDLGTLGGSCGYANWLNNRGQVVGTMTLAGDTTNHAFLWDRGVLTDLKTLGGNNSEAWFANDAGEVVGRADFSPANTHHHPFLWRHGEMKDLGTLAGQPEGTAFGINSRSQVVGGEQDTNNDAWLWEEGSIVDLNTLVVPPNPNVQVQAATAINDRGEIVAAGILTNGDSHVVVLIPCDENHTGIKDCDYSWVAASSAAQSSPPEAKDTAAASSRDRKHLMDRRGAFGSGLPSN